MLPEIEPGSEWTERQIIERWFFFRKNLFPDEVRRLPCNNKDELSFRYDRAISYVRALIASGALKTIRKNVGRDWTGTKDEFLTVVTGDSLLDYEREHNKKDQYHDFFGDDDKIYAKNLHIAMIAWKAVAEKGEGEGTTPGKRLENWLNKNYPRLEPGEHKAIVKVCNWNPDLRPGRPKKI